MNNSPMETEVLIVGAGPTGLMAANQLMRFGVDFILIDSKSGPTRESRAILVTARSLETYKQLGIAQHAIDHGVAIKTFNLFYDGKLKAEVKIGELGKGLSDYGYMLAFEQSKNEELLADRIKESGKTIHWNHEFVELKEYEKGIDAIVKNGVGNFNIKAKYMIACDGARSPVRHQLNFSFKGGTYEHKFFVADSVIKWDLAYNKLIVAPGKKNFCAFMPMQGERKYRILGTMPKEFSDKENITFEEIQEVVLNTMKNNIEIESTDWFSTYKLHHRSVDRFSQGKVHLAGDSAHIHSPAGGQGMNTGLQDASNLCWKLAMVLKYYRDEKLLDTYNEERLPFAKLLLKFTDRGFNMMTNSNPGVRFFRKYIAMNIANIFLEIPSIKKMTFRTLSQIGYSYKESSLSETNSKQGLAFKSGDRLPYVSIHGNAETIHDLVKKACFHLLHVSNEKLSAEINTDCKANFPFPLNIVECKLTEAWNKIGVKSEIFILVRPDNYICFIFDNYNKILLQDYLNKNYPESDVVVL